jgi:hypothetical protein
MTQCTSRSGNNKHLMRLHAYTKTGGIRTHENWKGFVWEESGGKYYLRVGARASANRESRTGWGSDGRFRIRFSGSHIPIASVTANAKHCTTIRYALGDGGGVQQIVQLSPRKETRVCVYGRDIVRVRARECARECGFDKTTTPLPIIQS